MKRRLLETRKYFVGVLMTVILTLGFGLQSTQAQESGEGQTIIGPIVGPKVAPKSSKPARELPPAPPPTGQEVNPIQGDPGAPPLAPAPLSPQGVVDPVAQLQDFGTLALDLLSSPIVNVLGQGGATPNDTNGDVGPNDFVQMINSTFQIFDKQGNPRGAPAAISTLWTSADPTDTSECATQNAGDPIVLYDNLADRWLLSQFAQTQFICIAISQTADPTGTYYLYQFDTGRFPDYFKIGAWPDGYYVSANLGGPDTPLVAVFDRANMLNGNPAGSVVFEGPSQAGTSLDLILPSDVDGVTNPPPGTPNFMYRPADSAVHGGAFDRLEVWEFSVNWTTPASSTFTGPTNIPTAPFDVTTCGYVFPSACIPQPGTATILHAIPFWGMHRFPYRNFGTHEVLAGNFTVDADSNDGVGVRWFVLERSGGGAWSVANEGTYAPQPAGAPAFVHRWMASLAMDRFENLALGHSRSSAQDPTTTAGSGNPSAYYTGRVAGDPLGLLPQPEILIRQGQGVTTSQRWGDYYSMSVDPVDDCTFWYTGDSTNANGSRQSSIASFRFADCAADLSIDKDANPELVFAGEQLFYEITVTNDGPIDAPDVEVVDTLPSGVEYVTDTDSCVEGPTGTLTCDLGIIASGDSASFTIKVVVDADLVSAAGGPTTITNTATVSYDRPDLDDSNNEASVTTIVEDSADLKVTKLCKPDGPLPAGDTAICEIFVDNLGLSDARNVRVIDTHVANGPFTIGSVSTTQGSCGPPANGVVTCALGVLPANVPDNRAVITIELTADEKVDINNTATASSDTPDPDTTNNMAMGSISVTALADLELIKSDDPDPVIAGETLTYDLTVTNYGPSTAVNVLIEDFVPAGVSIVSVSATGGACNAGVPGDSTQPATCAFNSLANGAGETMTIEATVLPDTQGILHNDAQVSSGTFDDNNANDLASTDTQVDSEADLIVDKMDNPDPVQAGAPLAYSIDVSNNGPSTALDVMLTDTLPGEVSFDNASATNGGLCNFVVPNTVECELGSLDPNETVTVYINVTVDPSVPDGTTIQNHVTVISATTDPDGASDSEDTLVNASADLWIDKTGNFPTGNPSGTILYFLTVYNEPGCSEDDPQVCGDGGPSNALNIVVTDTLPSTAKKLPVEFVSENCIYDEDSHTVTCTEPVLAAGDRVTFEIQVRAKGGLREITNVVDVVSSTTDPNAGNNHDELLMIVKGGTGDSGGPGGGRGRGGGPAPKTK